MSETRSSRNAGRPDEGGGVGEGDGAADGEGDDYVTSDVAGGALTFSGAGPTDVDVSLQPLIVPTPMTTKANITSVHCIA